MNISTPVHDESKNEFVIENGEIINKSLIVVEKLAVYQDDIKVLIKSSFSNSKELRS